MLKPYHPKPNLLLGLLTFCLIFFGAYNKSFGYHVIGTDIDWEQLTKDSFKITVTVYRDCNNVNLIALPITAKSTCGSQQITTTSTFIKDVTPVCDQQCSRCSGGSCTFKYGVEKHEQIGILVVTDWRKKSCCEATLSWSVCCRSFSSFNDHYTEAKISFCNSKFDHSPTFILDPETVICLFRDFTQSVAANDVDQDSLVYSFTTPLTGPTTKWSGGVFHYLGSPNASRPLPGGYHLDSSSGLWQFRPMKEEQVYVAIKIEEYRFGKLIGIKTRDVLITSLRCPSNIPPTLSGANCKTSSDAFNIEVCAGEALCFKVCTADDDKDDTVTISSLHQIPGATFTVLNKGKAKKEAGSFCWTPHDTDASPTPYTLVVAAKDNACPIPGKSSQTFRIWVKKTAPKATIDTSSSQCGQLNLVGRRTGNTLVDSFKWNINGYQISNEADSLDSISYRTRAFGKVPVSLTVQGKNGCLNRVLDTLNIRSHLNVDGGPDTVVCEGSAFNLRARAISPSGSYKIKWSTGDSSLNAAANTTFSVGSKDTFATIRAEDGTCEARDTIFFTVKNPPIFDLGADIPGCMGRNQPLAPSFTLDSTETDSLFTYQWFKQGDTTVQSTNNPWITEPLGTYILEVRDSLGCVSKDSVSASYDVSWLPKDTSICAESSVQITLAAAGRTYSWYDTPQDTSGPPNYQGNSRILRSKKTQYVGIKRTNNDLGYPCITYDSFQIVVRPLPNIQVSPPRGDVCTETQSVTFVALPAGGKWTGPSIASTNNTLTIDSFDGMTGNYEYYYSYTDPTGCTNIETTPLTVHPMPGSSFTLSDTIIMKGKSVTLNDISASSPSAKSFWFVGSPNFFQGTGNSITFTPDTLGKHQVTHIRLDTLTLCSDTTSAWIEIVLPNTTTETQMNAVSIFPNPASHSISVSFSNTDSGSLLLRDLSGKVVFSELVRNNQPILLPELADGLYFWLIESGDQRALGKLVLERK